MKPERILVTGGAGFIGSHTVDCLLNAGKQVVVLDNLSNGKLSNLNLNHHNIEFIEGDVLEYPLVKDLLMHCDAVLHLAAISSVQQSILQPIYSFQVNVQGLLHILEAIHAAKRSIRLVYASSAAIYGDAKELPCRDDTQKVDAPLSSYALQKINDEQYAMLYAQLFNINSLGLRYFNVYGERQDPHSPYSGVISRFLHGYEKNETLTVFGDGSQSRDFIHVSDVARANLLALENTYSGVLNIATGRPQTILELIQYIEKAGNRPVKIEYQAKRIGDIHASYAATTRAEKQLGFKSHLALDAGIKNLMASIYSKIE